MRRQWLKGIAALLGLATLSLALGQEAPVNPIAEWLRSRTGSAETPLDLPEQGEAVLFDGTPDTLPLKPRLVPLGGGQVQFPVTEHVYRGLPSGMVLTFGYGSGGQLVFARPLRLTAPLTRYELTLTLVPPVPTEIPTTPQQPQQPGQPGAPAMPGAPGAGGPEGEAGGIAPGAPFGPRAPGVPGPSAPGAPFAGPFGYGGPGVGPMPGVPFGGPFGSPFGGPFMGSPFAGQRAGIRRFLNFPPQMPGGLGPMGGAPGPMVGPRGGMLGPGGETGVGAPGPAGAGGAYGTAPVRQPPVLRTLKHLALLLFTDKGLVTLSFRVPPDDTLTFDGIWATIVVPLQLIGNPPEPPLVLYRLGISGDAPEELYIARITLRPRTPDRPFVQLRSPTLQVPVPGPDGKTIPRYRAQVNQPFVIEAFVSGTVLPMEVRWDFTPDNGVHFEVPDRRGRQVAFTFDKAGLYDCAVWVRDVFGVLPPIVERFQVEVR